jgi:hypothetical protein
MTFSLSLRAPTGVQATIACNRARRQCPSRYDHPTGILQFTLNPSCAASIFAKTPLDYTPKSPNRRQQTASSSHTVVGRPRLAPARERCCAGLCRGGCRCVSLLPKSMNGLWPRGTTRSLPGEAAGEEVSPACMILL